MSNDNFNPHTNKPSGSGGCAILGAPLPGNRILRPTALRPIQVACRTLLLLALCATWSSNSPARADVIDTFDATGIFQGGQSLGGTLTVDTTTGTISNADLTVTGQPDFDYVNNQYPISSSTQLLQLTSPANEAVPGLQFPSLSLLLPSSLVGYGGSSILPQTTGNTPGLNIPIQYSSGVSTLTQPGPGGLISGSLNLLEQNQPVFQLSGYPIIITQPNGQQKNTGIAVIATATDSVSGQAISLGTAASELGVDHFNWIQVDKSDTALSACAGQSFAPGSSCNGYTTISGKVAPVGTVDPPLGGWQYMGAPPNGKRPPGFPSPTADFYPMYLDEHFSPYKQSLPQGLIEYQAYQLTTSTIPAMWPDSNLVASGILNAHGLYFQDVPDTAGESVSFDTFLVGVSGNCSALAVDPSCRYVPVDGNTGFMWSSTNSNVVGPYRDNDDVEGEITSPYPLEPLGCSQQICGEFVPSLTILSQLGIGADQLGELGGNQTSVPEPGSGTILQFSICMVIVFRMRYKTFVRHFTKSAPMVMTVIASTVYGADGSRADPNATGISSLLPSSLQPLDCKEAVCGQIVPSGEILKEMGITPEQLQNLGRSELPPEMLLSLSKDRARDSTR